MLRFEWNALRVGDRVVVHDPLGTEFPRQSGTVAMVETKRSKRGANGVGIRVATDGGRHRVVWPSVLAAHHDPLDPTEDCWQCAALAETAARQLVASAWPSRWRPRRGPRLEAVRATALGDGHVAVLMKRDAGTHASA
jgi:hypothetical protein